MKAPQSEEIQNSRKENVHRIWPKGFALQTGILLGLLLLFIVLVQWFYGAISLEAARDLIRKMGWAGVPIYILLFVIGSFFLASATALSVIAPALFGPWIGFAAILAGNMAAAVSMFSATRWAGSRWKFIRGVQERLPEGLIRLAHGNGLLLVFYARLVMLPASLVNYIAALLPISFFDAILGTFLGVFSHSLSTALSIGILRDAFLANNWSALIRWEAALLAATYLTTFSAVYLLRGRIRHATGSAQSRPPRSNDEQSKQDENGGST